MKFNCTKKGCTQEGIVIEYFKTEIKFVSRWLCYFEPGGGQIICSGCKTPLEEVNDGEFKGFCTVYSTFNSKTSSEKREILKKRERVHQSKDKNFKDYKHFKDTGGQD